jgi:hypothetical protein
MRDKRVIFQGELTGSYKNIVAMGKVGNSASGKLCLFLLIALVCTCGMVIGYMYKLKGLQGTQI